MEDPLGANVSNPVRGVYSLESIQKWSDVQPPEYNMIVDSPEIIRTSPFLYAPDLNEKISLWKGDISSLGVDAIVNSTNESLTDRNVTTERIYNRAGSALRHDVKYNVHGCKTGEAKLTKGYRLPARYVIHTVGPRYNIKYKTAADSALYNCYRHILELVTEHNIASLGISSVHTLRRGYPSYEGAHIAIRTVRRFMEQLGSHVSRIIFVVTNEDHDVYNNLLPLYFPRSKSEEEFAAYHLPRDVGNDTGEPVVADRQIRIEAKPALQAERVKAAMERQESNPELFLQSININEAFDMSVAVGQHAFSRMEGDVDKTRKQRSHVAMNIEAARQEQAKRYDKWLRRSRQEDLSEISNLRCFYQSGFDKKGRPVFVFIGKLYPAKRANLEKSLMHLIQTMDSMVNNSFVVVYFHSQTTSENIPLTEFIRDALHILDYRYKKNLTAFYVIHPTLWAKVRSWVFTHFSEKQLKGKVCTIPGLEYLYSRISPDQLDLPEFIQQHDIKINGTRYYDPDTDRTIGFL